MRKLIASTFASLDGVMQAPGGPTEDPTGGFAFGGWLFGFDVSGDDLSASGFDGKDRELLLGRRTYEIFEAYWPYQADDNPIAKALNAAKKHVASRTLKSAEWNNSSVLACDLVAAVQALKAQPGLDLQIIGSGNLIQTLQAEALIDEYHIWTIPVVLGRGKRLFENNAKPSALRLTASKVALSGVVMSTYVPAGAIQLGTVGPPQKPSAKESARQARMEKGEM